MTSRSASCSCGQLRIEVEGEPRGVGVGAFADPQFPAPQVSVYDCRRHSWVQLPPGVTAFEKDPP
jgi:hypothetical protein